MSTSLYAITNSKFTGNETEKDWNQILVKLKSLNWERTYRYSKGKYVQESGDWSYSMNDNPELSFLAEFDGPFQFCPVIYSNIGLIHSIAHYSYIYQFQDINSFNQFRVHLYKIVQIMGGTEVIFLADNACDKLCHFLESMAIENVPYEEIKEKMIVEFGNPVTDYSKLDDNKLDYRNINEFMLDDFTDLKSISYI